MDVRMDFPSGQAFAEALHELGKDISGEILATALVAGAAPIRDDAATRAEIHRGPRRRPEAVPLAETIRTTVERMGAIEADVHVGTNSPIAHLVEFGHAEVRSHHQVGTVPAYPFLRPAADAHEEEAVAIIADTLGREIEKAFEERAPHETA
jgi:HK97 gp10 family phage protein